VMHEEHCPVDDDDNGCDCEPLTLTVGARA
jgi:hypothetical protein